MDESTKPRHQAPTDLPTLVGKTIGRYKITGRLGRGGMATVFRGLDTELRREVAVKLMNLELAQDLEMLERFRREARLLASLNDPNIVQVFDFGVTDIAGMPYPYLVVEFVDGTDLKGLMDDRGRIPFEVALMMSAQMLGSLAKAHEAGIVHRDLKPENFLVSKQGRVKLTDFGIARSSHGTSLTHSKQFMGTIAYMAPETLDGKGMDELSDLFAAGIILYELFGGDHPFSGPEASMTQLIKNITEADPPPLGEEGSPMWPDVSDAIEKALAKEPDQRFKSAANFQERLDRILEPTGLTKTEGEIEQYVASRPGYERALRRRVTDTLVEKGRLLMAHGRRADALEHFDRVLTLVPDHSKVKLLMARESGKAPPSRLPSSSPSSTPSSTPSSSSSLPPLPAPLQTARAARIISREYLFPALMFFFCLSWGILGLLFVIDPLIYGMRGRGLAVLAISLLLAWRASLLLRGRPVRLLHFAAPYCLFLIFQLFPSTPSVIHLLLLIAARLPGISLILALGFSTLAVLVGLALRLSLANARSAGLEAIARACLLPGVILVSGTVLGVAIERSRIRSFDRARTPLLAQSKKRPQVAYHVEFGAWPNRVGIFQRNSDRMEASFADAAALGCPWLVFPLCPPSKKADLARALDILKQRVDKAREKGLKVLLVLPDGNILTSIRKGDGDIRDTARQRNKMLLAVTKATRPDGIQVLTLKGPPLDEEQTRRLGMLIARHVIALRIASPKTRVVCGLFLHRWTKPDGLRKTVENLLGRREGADAIAVGGYFRPGDEKKLTKLLTIVADTANELGTEAWLCPFGYGFRERILLPTPNDGEAAFHRFAYALAAAKGYALYGPRCGLGLYSDRLAMPRDLGRKKPTELRLTVKKWMGGKVDGLR